MVILIWALMGFLTALVADQKKRNVPLWAAMGFLFGIFALLVVLALPSAEDKQVPPSSNTLVQ